MNKGLVIAPKRVALTVWAQECEKWDHLKNIRCSHIMGTEKQRIAALQKDADLYIINRENVVWLMEYLHYKPFFQMLILDELSSFKSAQSKRWKALKKIVGSVRYVLGLTGTPAPNNYLDLWPEVYLLDQGERLGRKIGDYRDRYFRMGAHKGHVVYEWKLRVGAQDAINRQLKDLCLSMSAEDWLTLPPIIYNNIWVQMTPAARRDYDRLKKDKVIPLLGQERIDIQDDEKLEQMTSAIRGDTAAAVAGKLLQMANGAVYDDEGGVIHIHDEKLDALEELVDANDGEPLLVFYGYKHDQERIKERFRQARDLVGPEDVEDWNAGKIPMLLCHPASAGHGLNLQHGGHIIVWFGLTWSLELYQQANARLPRPGQTRPVFIHHIACKDTMDENVIESLHAKDEGQSSLLNALKGYLKEE